jgi:hypothetical protein
VSGAPASVSTTAGNRWEKALDKSLGIVSSLSAFQFSIASIVSGNVDQTIELFCDHLGSSVEVMGVGTSAYAQFAPPAAFVERYVNRHIRRSRLFGGQPVVIADL